MNIRETTEKLKGMLQKTRSHWYTPPQGYQVSYKEFAAFAVGSGGLSFLSILVTWTTLAASTPMIISYFEASPGMIFALGFLGSVIALIRAPILSAILDNSNSKKGKFKPFLLWTGLLSGIIFSLIPYIPQSWVEKPLLTISIPELSVFTIPASEVTLSLGLLVMFLLLQIGTFFYTLLSQSVAGIEQTISSVAQERANIGALKGLLSNIPGSLVNIALPLVSAAFFAVGEESGMNNIMLYRIFFPISFFGGFFLLLFLYRGTTERAVLGRNFVNRVSFREGAKALSGNKYFWILAILNAALAVRGMANIYLWTCTYAIGGSAGDTAAMICNMVLNNAFIPGMVFGPLLVKRFGKRNTMLVANIGVTAMVTLQLFLLGSPYLILGGIFFQNLFSGVGYMSAIMVSDVLDYQQWKTGKRLEGFWQNYSAFILTITGFFTSMLMPIALSIAGIHFDDNIKTALQDASLRSGAFYWITVVAAIGSAAAMIPMFFYDLTEKKHAQYVCALRLRAASENLDNGCADEEDAKQYARIAALAQEKQDAFLLEELQKHEELAQFAATAL